jgi:hypothetical protein
MAQHIGSEKDAPLELYEDKDHYTRNKLLFWSLFVQDRLLSLSTGRLCTVSTQTSANERLVLNFDIFRYGKIWLNFLYRRTRI